MDIGKIHHVAAAALLFADLAKAGETKPIVDKLIKDAKTADVQKKNDMQVVEDYLNNMFDDKAREDQN